MAPTKQRLLEVATWAAWSLALLAFVLEVPLLIANEPFATTEVPPVVLAVEDLAFVAIATLSLLILRKQPGNRVGWAMMLVGVTFPVEGLFAELTAYSVRTWGVVGLSLLAGWVSRWVWIGSNLAVPLILLYYPDGELPSPGWRWAVRYIWAMAALIFMVSAVNGEPMDEFGGLENPIGIALPGVLDPLAAVAFSSFLLMPLVGAASLVPRYRRSDGVERQQMKLIVWVAIVALLFFLIYGYELMGDVGPTLDSIVNTIFTVFVGTAIAAGIVRYRVFEIDRIISRTVSYSVVVAVIAAGYFGIVTVVTRFLPSQDALVVAAATLAAAAVFNPLRRRIQAAADRRFNRSGYEAELVAREFASQIHDGHSVEQIGQSWHDAVVETMEPATAGLWLNDSALKSTRGR